MKNAPAPFGAGALRSGTGQGAFHLQAQQLLFLGAEFFLSDDAGIQQLLILPDRGDVGAFDPCGLRLRRGDGGGGDALRGGGRDHLVVLAPAAGAAGNVGGMVTAAGAGPVVGGDLLGRAGAGDVSSGAASGGGVVIIEIVGGIGGS